MILNMWLPQHPSFGNDNWYIAHSHNHNIINKEWEKLSTIVYKAFLENTYEREKKLQKCKSSLNIEYTYKIEVSITICDSIYSSTRTASKHKINDWYVMNDQTDVHSSCSYRNYYKAYLNDEISDK